MTIDSLWVIKKVEVQQNQRKESNAMQDQTIPKVHKAVSQNGF